MWPNLAESPRLVQERRTQARRALRREPVADAPMRDGPPDGHSGCELRKRAAGVRVHRTRRAVPLRPYVRALGLGLSRAAFCIAMVIQNFFVVVAIRAGIVHAGEAEPASPPSVPRR